METDNQRLAGVAKEIFLKPKLRGVSHQIAFFISLAFGIALLLFAAKSTKALIALGIYAVSLSALLGTSAVYHRVNWKQAQTRLLMRRLDHSMIFFLIAGTYTPFSLLALHGVFARIVLAVVWTGALAAAVVEVIWIEHPRWIAALIYVGLGSVAVISFPDLWTSIGATATVLLGLGGLLYVLGAVVYAAQRPDPDPKVFGYHEIFHALVIAAAGLQA